MSHLIPTRLEKALTLTGPFLFFRLRIILFLALLFFSSIFSEYIFPPASVMAQESSKSQINFLADYIALHSRTPMSSSIRSRISWSLLGESRRQNVPIYLAVAVVQQESGFDPDALNASSQDYGLFQVHFPFWRRYFARKKDGKLHPLHPEELFQIPVNVHVGMMILKHDLDLEKNDLAKGIGLYSGRKGEARSVYLDRIYKNEIAFLVFMSLKERSQRSVESVGPGEPLGEIP
ncbi:MAG: transglycosylase SLT domain-containing protein [Leptospirales bacterium]